MVGDVVDYNTNTPCAKRLSLQLLSNAKGSPSITKKYLGFPDSTLGLPSGVRRQTLGKPLAFCLHVVTRNPWQSLGKPQGPRASLVLSL